MSFYQQVEEIIGLPPVGYEPLLYIAVVIFALFIMTNCFILIGGIIRKLGGM